jgi:hypothetical protein
VGGASMAYDPPSRLSILVGGVQRSTGQFPIRNEASNRAWFSTPQSVVVLGALLGWLDGEPHKRVWCPRTRPGRWARCALANSSSEVVDGLAGSVLPCCRAEAKPGRARVLKRK